jgi:hypothetical protein
MSLACNIRSGLLALTAFLVTRKRDDALRYGSLHFCRNCIALQIALLQCVREATEAAQ